MKNCPGYLVEVFSNDEDKDWQKMKDAKEQGNKYKKNYGYFDSNFYTNDILVRPSY